MERSCLSSWREDALRVTESVPTKSWRRYPPTLLFVLLAGCLCEEPWPEPPPSQAAYLTVVPREIDIQVADPTREVTTDLLAFVHDEYGWNLPDHTTQFSVPAGVTGLAVAPIGANPDEVVLKVVAACATAENCPPPPPFAGRVTARLAASGLSIDIPVNVRYGGSGFDGVAATPVGATPMFGVASGKAAGAWQNHRTRAFIRRAEFAKFDANVASLPGQDVASGTVLSSAYGAWRKVDPWGATPSDVSVPAATAPSQIRLRVRYAAEPARFAANQNILTVGVQGAADIVSRTPIGARATIEGSITAVTPIGWSGDCALLGDDLAAALAPTDQPDPKVIAVYMVDATAAPGAPRAFHCGPGTLGATSAFATAHVVVLWEGSAPAATVAHEIGHALALGHVTFGSGIFGDNLMTEANELSAPLRNRLTVGQAWRAAFHTASYIVTAQQATSTTVDCLAEPARCPSQLTDVRGRTP